MTYGKALTIFSNIDSGEFTDQEKGIAIHKIMTMCTHNSVSKDRMLDVIEWLWNRCFEFQRVDAMKDRETQTER